jgi:hypothetical protein
LYFLLEAEFAFKKANSFLLSFNLLLPSLGIWFIRNNQTMYRWIFAGIPILISFIGCLIIMIKISFSVCLLVKQNSQHARSWRQSPRDVERYSPRLRRTPQPSPSRRTDGSSNLRDKEVALQATLFIAAFFCTFVFAFVARIMEQDPEGGGAPFLLLLLTRTLNPLQGFFNILVYTRPHVSALRRRHLSYSRLRAFWIVVKAGGDHDRPSTGRRTRRLSWISRQNPKHTAKTRNNEVKELSKKKQDKDSVIPMKFHLNNDLPQSLQPNDIEPTPNSDGGVTPIETDSTLIHSVQPIDIEMYHYETADNVGIDSEDLVLSSEEEKEEIQT